MKKETPVHELKCAIYTRKSTEEGLEQEFNTLDAQRESAECYIKSQEAEGWICLPDHYDDGGYTGGNMDSTALMRLLADTTHNPLHGSSDLLRRPNPRRPRQRLCRDRHTWPCHAGQSNADHEPEIASP